MTEMHVKAVENVTLHITVKVCKFDLLMRKCMHTIVLLQNEKLEFLKGFAVCRMLEKCTKCWYDCLSILKYVYLCYSAYSLLAAIDVDGILSVYDLVSNRQYCECCNYISSALLRMMYLLKVACAGASVWL